jgi:hypothetical protein
VSDDVDVVYNVHVASLYLALSVYFLFTKLFTIMLFTSISFLFFSALGTVVCAPTDTPSSVVLSGPVRTFAPSVADNRARSSLHAGNDEGHYGQCHFRPRFTQKCDDKKTMRTNVSISWVRNVDGDVHTYFDKPERELGDEIDGNEPYNLFDDGYPHRQLHIWFAPNWKEGWGTPGFQYADCRWGDWGTSVENCAHWDRYEWVGEKLNCREEQNAGKSRVCRLKWVWN